MGPVSLLKIHNSPLNLSLVNTHYIFSIHCPTMAINFFNHHRLLSLSRLSPFANLFLA